MEFHVDVELRVVVADPEAGGEVDAVHVLVVQHPEVLDTRVAEAVAGQGCDSYHPSLAPVGPLVVEVEGRPIVAGVVGEGVSSGS